jgi:hypothetical protein
VWEREQFYTDNVPCRTRPAFALAAGPFEATVLHRLVHSPQIEAQCAFRTVADSDGAELGGVLADPVAAHAEHRRHGSCVDVAPDTGLLAKELDDARGDRVDVCCGQREAVTHAASSLDVLRSAGSALARTMGARRYIRDPFVWDAVGNDGAERR